MNDTNRLMLAVGIALFAYAEYPESWVTIAFAAFIMISMSSEAIRQTRDGIEHFRQMLEGEQS